MTHCGAIGSQFENFHYQIGDIAANSLSSFVWQAASMKLIVCNKSALHFWYRVTTSLDAVSYVAKRTQVTNAVSCVQQLAQFGMPEVDFGPAPLHVLAGKDEWRLPSKYVCCHRLIKQYPVEAFRQVSANMYVSSPELCFFEMASELSFHRLIELGWFLCGTYAFLPGGGITNNRRPLTRRSRLEAFLCKCASRRGVARARRALMHVCDNSVSPMETKLALLLCLPIKMGGYGMPRPTMNYEVNYSQDNKKLFHRNKAVLDIFWPEYALGLEYDGREFHGDSDIVSEDRKKSSAMASCGITLIHVDRKQLANPQEVYTLAKKIGRITKRYVKKPTDVQWRHHLELFSALLRV